MAPLYPQPGCIVEFLEDNAPKIAVVLEDAGNKLRLLLPGRRETKLSPNRILPWRGPVLPAGFGKDEAERSLEAHQAARRQKKAEISALDAWEMANGEITQAPASWFAELFQSDPDSDAIAACGHALLDCKTHFRFQSPDFLVYDAEFVKKRLGEQKAREEKEAITSAGSAFLKLLWDAASQKKKLAETPAGMFPDPALEQRISDLLFSRMVDPESTSDEALWRMLSRGLPDVPHLPFQLLAAWGRIPAHYNFWLDRADYARGDSWWQESAELVETLAQQGRMPDLPQCNLPFVSIDGPDTVDIDDAFHILRSGDGYELTIALAAPALNWPFGEELDREVLHRATSIYLPEGTLHMLPEILGADAYSLRAGERRPAFCLKIALDAEGRCRGVEPFLATVNLAANLRYQDVQRAIAGNPEALPAYADLISLGHELALRREKLRIAAGGIVMLREEPELAIIQEGDDVEVRLEREKPIRDAQRLVSELMILSGAAIADWAAQRDIPLLYRTQNVALPPEYAGIWEDPADIFKIMRSLIPSSLEVTPKSHAALGLSRYAQATSPLRRYTDLINEAQIISYLKNGAPAWDGNGLDELLGAILPSLEAASHVQRYRPRYWKLLYFRQAGDRVWYNGVVTDENEMFVNVALPAENIFVRGRRNLFDERVSPGVRVKLRLGKINPLLNEIQILEALTDE